MNILEMGIDDLLKAYQAGTLSPVQVMETMIAQTDRVEPDLNAFVVRESSERLLEMAKASEDRWRSDAPQGMLDGIPITVKDAILATPWPLRNGSHSTSDTPSNVDAPAVLSARKAGAIVVGKTTTPEFGWKAVTDSPLTGVTRNPWDLRTTPGGSSGGAAAAVAAGCAVASIGTDAGGSVRIPAALCGLVALKASRGRIPAFPPSAVWTAGHIGPIAHTVRDVARMLDVMKAPDPRDWNGLPPSDFSYLNDLDHHADIAGLRVAYSPTLGHATVDSEVAALVENAVSVLSGLGAMVTTVAAPLPDARKAFGTYFATGLDHALRHLSNAQREQLDPGLAFTLKSAQENTQQAFLDAYDFQVRISREARLFHQQFDLLVTPTVSVPAFPVGRNVPEGYDQDDILSWWPFTYPFNLSGQPALTVCCGYTRAGLPVGLQFVSEIYREELVLRAGAAFEANRTFSVRRAPCIQTG